MGFIPKSSQINTFRLSAAGLIALATVAMVAIAVRLERLNDATYRTEFRLEKTLYLIEAREDLERYIFGHFLDLQALSVALARNPDMTQAEFSEISARIANNRPDILRIFAAPDSVIRFVYPVSGNERMLGTSGVDLGVGALSALGLSSGIHDGHIFGPLKSIDGGQRMQFRHPVYKMTDGGDQRGAFWGNVVVTVDYEKFFAGDRFSNLTSEFDVLITTGGSNQNSPARVIFGDPSIEEKTPISLDFDLSFGPWRIMALPAGGWPQHAPNYTERRIGAFFVIGTITLLLILICRLTESRQTVRLRLRDAINSMSGGFGMFDAGGHLIVCNQDFAKLYNPFGGTLEIGDSMEDIMREGLRQGQIPQAVGREEEWLRDRLALFHSGAYVAELEFPNGQAVLARDAKMNDGGTVCVRTDVTDLKKAQRAAEASNVAKTEFINMLSHELRTPLTVILALAKMGQLTDRLPVVQALIAELDATPIDPVAIRLKLNALLTHFTNVMGKQAKSGDHLLQLINGILDLSKLESNNLEVDVKKHSVADFVGEMAEQFADQARRKGLDFKTTSCDAWVACDEMRTRQILYNLLGNAFKFTDQGEVSLVAETRDGAVRFSVTDSGTGIGPDDLDLVFEEFKQVDSSMTRKSGGAGLGLAISRNLAQLQGGLLWVESELGVGSTFILELPEAAADTATFQAETVPDYSGLRALT